MKLYLGTHRPTWLSDPSSPPLMVSLNTLPKRAPWRAEVGWFIDSAGFTELQKHGRWRTTAAEHAERCCALVERIGMVEHVSPQDWMCEPIVIAGGTVRIAGRLQTFAGTGLSVAVHQERTVTNYLELIDIAPELPWVPVLQGWEVDDYHRCADLYRSAGVDLAAAPLVGVGSVCRRESTPDAVCANHRHYALTWWARTAAQVAPLQLSIEGAA